jgi:phage gpG-like protein
VITGYLIGDTELIARMGQMYPNAQRGLLAAVTRLATQLQRHVMQDKLSGQVLRVRTGTLRRSINQRVEQSGDSTTGTVGTNIKYARAHEYGGAVMVPAHQRRMTMVFGRPVQERMINVRAHTATYPERSFLRSALKDMEAQIKSGMEKALVEAVKK